MIIGLDTATDRWHAVQEDGGIGFCSKLVVRKATPRWADPDARRWELRETFHAYLTGLATGLQEPDGGSGLIDVYCEEPLALQNGKTTRLLSLAAGALWDVGCSIGRAGAVAIRWHWVDVSHWKRVVVGNGNADKDKIREHVLGEAIDHTGLGGQNPDEYEDEPDLFDAWCLCRYGLMDAAGLVPAVLPRKPKRKKAA